MASSPQSSINREGNRVSSMATDLPEDLLVNILVRLPVNSLLCCRCVCKSWCSLIYNPTFISAHHNRNAPAGKSRTVIVRRRDLHTRIIRYTLHSNDESLTEIAEFGFPFEFFRILGSVNGLICMLNDNYVLMLWNPAIRKSLILPNPSSCRLTDPRSPLFGFGFDPLGNDYKVVRISYGRSGPRVKLYRLSARSWSRIDLGGEGFTLPLLFPRQAYMNGVVHWLGHDSTIVGFDLRTETFRVMDLPGDLKGKTMEDIVIAAWCGLLALFELEDSKSICLWVMKEYDVVESWSRQCVIPSTAFPRRVRSIGPKGKILFENGLGSLFWFDPATQEIGELAIHGHGHVDLFHMKSYTESLVLADVRV